MASSFRISRDVRYRLIDDEAVVVRQREGDVLVLNEVAARVLQLVGEGLTPSQVGDRIVGEFEAPDAAIRQDVETFFDELEGLNVIERCASNGDVP